MDVVDISDLESDLVDLRGRTEQGGSTRRLRLDDELDDWCVVSGAQEMRAR